MRRWPHTVRTGLRWSGAFSSAAGRRCCCGVARQSRYAEKCYSVRMFEARFQSFDDPAEPAAGAPRVAALRTELARRNLTGFIVPRADRHQNEYVPAAEERLAWLTGFTGSARPAGGVDWRAAPVPVRPPFVS